MKIDLKVFKNRVIVTEIEFGNKITKNGLILVDDDGKSHGIKSRWAKVWKVGPDVKDLVVGDYVLLKHGRWTRFFNIDTEEGILRVGMIDYPDAVLLISKERPDNLDEITKL